MKYKNKENKMINQHKINMAIDERIDRVYNELNNKIKNKETKMGYWSTIDKNQKQTESNTSRINGLTEKINDLDKLSGKLEHKIRELEKYKKVVEVNADEIQELEKQEKALTKIAELNADDIQDLQQENTNRELELKGLMLDVGALNDEVMIKEVGANQVVIDEVLNDCFQDLKVLCDSKTRTIKDNTNARFVNINNVIDIINKYSNSQKGRI